MRQITGMSIVTDWERRSVNVAVSPDFLGLSQESIYGTNSLVGPVRLPAGEIAPTFHVADESVEVLGIDMTTNLPGLVIKQMDGWTSVYSSAPGISAPVLRGLAKKAGAHIYVEEDAVVYAGASILSITVVEPGTRQIHPPHIQPHPPASWPHAGSSFAQEADRIATRSHPGFRRHVEYRIPEASSADTYL